MIKRIGLVVIQLLILVGFIFMASVSAVNAQESTQIISVNPAGLAFGVANVEYQKNISDSAAWALRGNYMSRSIGDWKFSAIGAGGSYKGFFSPTAPAGGYWDVGVDLLKISAEYKYTSYTSTSISTYPYIKTTATETTETGSATFIAPGAGIGYQWLFGNFGVSLGAKAIYFTGSIEVAGSKLPLSGIGLGGSLQLGYAW